MDDVWDSVFNSCLKFSRNYFGLLGQHILVTCIPLFPALVTWRPIVTTLYQRASAVVIQMPTIMTNETPARTPGARNYVTFHEVPFSAAGASNCHGLFGCHHKMSLVPFTKSFNLLKWANVNFRGTVEVELPSALGESCFLSEVLLPLPRA